jgi:DNA-binding NarL/FixJ family response regulator
VPRETLAALAGLSATTAEFVEEHGLIARNAIFRLRPGRVELSRRERVIVSELRSGDTLDAIASRLFVATNTVKAQLRSAYRKLGVSSREDALLRASELGLLSDLAPLDDDQLESRRDEPA